MVIDGLGCVARRECDGGVSRRQRAEFHNSEWAESSWVLGDLQQLHSQFTRF